MPSPRLLNADELSDHLNVPVSWVRRQTRLRTIPFIKAGRYVRFDLERVLEALNERTDDGKRQTPSTQP